MRYAFGAAAAPGAAVALEFQMYLPFAHNDNALVVLLQLVRFVLCSPDRKRLEAAAAMKRHIAEQRSRGHNQLNTAAHTGSTASASRSLDHLGSYAMT